MRCSRITLCLFVGLAIGSTVRADNLEAMAWLSGCWANAEGDAGSGEYWLPLAGGSMLGTGRTIRDGITVEFEFLRLHEDEQGRVVYTALPSGQQETEFLASTIDSSTATFENPAHDFPQKITYTRTDDAGLIVRIEGDSQGSARAVEFEFNKVACPE